MNDEVMTSRIRELPNPIKSELLDFLEFLLLKYNNQKISRNPKAGCMKGMFVLNDDFNDELDCFNDYRL